MIILALALAAVALLLHILTTAAHRARRFDGLVDRRVMTPVAGRVRRVAR